MEHVNTTAAIDTSVLAIVGGFSPIALLNRDYKWCAETMLNKFGSDALGRAERRARELLGDGNPGGYAIWIEVAATIARSKSPAHAESGKASRGRSRQQRRVDLQGWNDDPRGTP